MLVGIEPIQLLHLLLRQLEPEDVGVVLDKDETPNVQLAYIRQNQPTPRKMTVP